MRPLRHIVNPILLLAACSTKASLIRQIQYLKVENEVLRSRLPKPITTTRRERERLIRYASQVSRLVMLELVSIVSRSTMCLWLMGRAPKVGTRPRKPGRPRTPLEIEQFVIKVARETGWGYTRILGELKKLGIKSVSRSTVVNILKRHGLDPSPHRQKATWDEFIKRHASSLWSCDFFFKRVMTPRGWRCAIAMAFVNVKTRTAWVSPSTFTPDAAWIRPQVEAFFDAYGNDPIIRPRIILYDRDTRFGPFFAKAVEVHGTRAHRLIHRSPNLNAYVERFIQTIQQECLDHFIVFGTKHLDYLLKEFLEHYHEERPHQGLGERAAQEGWAGAVGLRGAAGSCAGSGSVDCSGTMSAGRRELATRRARPTFGLIARR